MTLDNAINRITLFYESDNQVLNSSEDDYEIRQNFLNAAIDLWSTQEKWNELFVVPDSFDTTDGTSTQYDLPSDFMKMSGYVRLNSSTTGSSYYEEIPSHKRQMYDNNTSAKKYFLTGNSNDGFKINFLTAPDSGYTIYYEYYRQPTLLSSGTDEFEMSDPMFAIYFAVSRLYEGDGNTNKALKAYQEANGILEAMILKNNSSGWMQDSRIPDSDSSTGGFGF